jgi:ribosomal protein L7/L12
MRGKLFAQVLNAASGIDWKAVVIQLAEKYPVSVADIIASQSGNTWKIGVRNAAPAGKVAAIKRMRELTGASLSHAKQWVEGDRLCCDEGDFEYQPCPVDNPFV